ncbi:PREDICTED: extracellular calcium-sensing receptor-like [Nanorana parkeri]|uniref:extracellular calcium-sensing receptor-like n=1 Tax=Nanorana parkeri TaxID=125878 RepID=UPI000854420B|nr:PREDICTED: extracellular calcium-sensing receptor-like [Nanorana parkeri]
MTFIYKSLWHVVQYYIIPVLSSHGPACTLDASDQTGITWNGDIMAGAVLTLHVEKEFPQLTFTQRPGQVICRNLPLEKYLQLQTIKFAMEEINSNPSLLPNVSLGFQIYDSCRVLQKELEGSLWMITGLKKAIPNFQCQKRKPLAAIIGYTTSTFSMLMAHILRVIKIPQISHVSTSSLLSDRTQFPFSLRTAPSDAYQSKGLAHLVLHFGWTYVGMIADSNDYGYQGIQGVRQELIKLGACVAFIEYIQNSRPDKNIPRIIQTIKNSRANAIVTFVSDVDLIPLLEELLLHNVTKKTWVASEGWATSTMLSSEKYSTHLTGTMGFAYYSEHIPGFRDFIENIRFSELSQLWDLMFWEEKAGCTFLDYKNITFTRERPARNCTHNDIIENVRISLGDVTSLRLFYNLYSAVYVIAKGLHDLHVCQNGSGPFLNGSCSDIWNVKPWQVFHYMKNVRLKLISGRDLFLDEHGDPPPVYDIVNWQKDLNGIIRQVKVGTYNSIAAYSDALIINMSFVQWASGNQQVPCSICHVSCLPGHRKASITGEPNCCYECVPCSQGEISNETDSTVCFSCPWNKWPSEGKDTCLPKPVEYLSYEETLGVTLASTSISSSFVPFAILSLLLYYKVTPIVRANNYPISCLLLVCLFLCFLCSLAFIGYPQREKCLLRQVIFGIAFTLCISCILAKTIMVMTAFRATKPNSDLRRWASPYVSYLVISLSTCVQFMICILWLHISPPFPEYNSKTKTGVLVLECNEGSPTAFWLTLGYLSLLALISFFVAFIARQLPDRFNEAKFITFSMLAFLSVWLSFIPAHLSTSGKYTVAMEIFAILSSTWVMLGCMFVPKCYIILFRPCVNSRKHLLAKK